MSNHETIQTIEPATVLELVSAICQQLPRNMPQEIALGWIGNKRALGKALHQALLPPTDGMSIPDEASRDFLEFVGTVDIAGEEGALLTNGYINIFYAKNQEYKLYVVHCVWSHSREEWSIYACKLSKLERWYHGAQIFSPHNSTT